MEFNALFGTWKSKGKERKIIEEESVRKIILCSMLFFAIFYSLLSRRIEQYTQGGCGSGSSTCLSGA